jgi:hypothetical protein
LKKKLSNVRWNTPLGATPVANAGAGVGAGDEAGPGRGAEGPSPLIHQTLFSLTPVNSGSSE